MVDFALTEAQRELRDKARAFALEQVLPRAFKYDALDELPLEVLRSAHEQGMLNLSIPEELGGAGLGLFEQALVVEEIAAACPGMATSLFDNALGTEPVLLSEADEIKKRLLPELIKEFKLISFATSEPTTGSDVAGIRCKAEQDGDDWVLSGTKFWITNGGHADYFTIFATVDPSSRHKGICAFLVEREWEGVTVGRPIPKLGQRCSNTVGVHFDKARVPAENLLAAPGEGFALAMKTFARTRPIIGAFATGAARSALEFALEHVRSRRAFGQKVRDFQATQFKLADMFQRVETSRLLTWRAAWEADQGRDPTVPASIAKLYSSESALEVVNDALQLMGGYGYTRMFPVEKLLRDTRLFSIYEGTSEVQRLVLGRHVTGEYEPVMPPFDELDVDQSNVDPDSDEPLWRCRFCGHIHQGPEPPDACPICFFPSGSFKQIER